MAKKGRPFTYQSDEERPVTISLRLAHDLYDRLERYASRHRQSVSELVRDGIELRLAVEADPRWQTAQEQETYYDNTVLQELATPAHFLDDGIPFDDEHQPDITPATAVVPDISYDSNMVIQETAPKRLGRKPVLREPILALLREYPDGLSATQMKVYLGTEKHIGDTLAGMVKAQLLVKNGTGQGLRYHRADVAGKDTR